VLTITIIKRQTESVIASRAGVATQGVVFVGLY